MASHHDPGQTDQSKVIHGKISKTGIPTKMALFSFDCHLGMQSVFQERQAHGQAGELTQNLFGRAVLGWRHGLLRGAGRSVDIARSRLAVG